MNLRFHINDELFWIHNFLPENLYKDMYMDYVKNRNKLNFFKSDVSWNTFTEELEDMSQSFNQNSKSKLNYFEKYHLFLRHQKFLNFLKYDFKSHIRMYKYGQHLRWHDDTDKDADFKENWKRKYGATYYFNRRWGESWGGELMFKTKNQSGFIPIVGNSLVIIKTGLRHKVNSNLKKTHNRLSIQTWVNSNE